MDWYPLWNSLRIAAVSCIVVFFLGILAAYYIARLPRGVKGILDVILTLPMVLPPTVCGYFLLVLLGPQRPLGKFLANFGVQFAMTWYGGIVASAVVAFPLMYRTARGVFESFDTTLAYSGQTLGLSNTYIFWRIRMPACRQGILAGTVLAFARALGEYGATSMLIGYVPGRTATISTTVYQLWRTNNEQEAFLWVIVNVVISTVILLAVNMLERRNRMTRVLFSPRTGRTHQLRIHAAHPLGLHCPILGDTLYGREAERLYLHAECLTFTHPVTARRIEIHSETPF